MDFIKTVTLVFLSFFTIIKCIFFKQKRAQYFIVKPTNDNLIDSRSEAHINKNDLMNSINFVRSVKFSTSVLIFFKYKNIIFFSSFLHIILLISYKKSKKKQLKLYKKVIKKIFDLIKIEEFHTIDDYRNVNFFSELCNDSLIKYYIYQHGRISKELRFQKNLSRLKFYRYFVWSNYFKNKLLSFNKKYEKDKIQIKKRFKNNSKAYRISKKNNILIIHENNIKTSTILKLLINLETKQKFNISYKFRPNEPINEKLRNFLETKNIKIYKNENVYKLFKTNEISFLIGFNSTLLLEASYFNIFPIQILEKQKYFKDYIKDKVVFYSKLNTIHNNILKFKKKEKKLMNIKKKVWY